jgi:hypothetical protein
MSDHQKETAFLLRCLRYEDRAEHQELDEKIARLERDDRCVRRSVWLMAFLTALALSGLGYTTVLIERFPPDTSQLFPKIISALGLASMICLVAFVGVRLVYRIMLDQRREECRQLVATIIESRLATPVTSSMRDRCVAEAKSTPRAAGEIAASSAQPESPAQS